MFGIVIFDALAKSHGMAKQKFRSTRRSGFSGVKAYIWYVEVLKKRCNAVDRTFCDAITFTYRILHAPLSGRTAA